MTLYNKFKKKVKTENKSFDEIKQFQLYGESHDFHSGTEIITVDLYFKQINNNWDYLKAIDIADLEADIFFD